jgi:hypothetical protein
MQPVQEIMVRRHLETVTEPSIDRAEQLMPLGGRPGEIEAVRPEQVSDGLPAPGEATTNGTNVAFGNCGYVYVGITDFGGSIDGVKDRVSSWFGRSSSGTTRASRASRVTE